MNEIITHEGVIEKFEDDKAYVRIISQSACSMCHSKGMCSVAEMSEKLIVTRPQSSKEFSAGQHVNVVLEKQLGNTAVVLGYFFPFVLVMVTLIIASRFTSELFSGLLSIAVLIPYYAVLFLFRHKLEKKYQFRIEKI